MWRLIRLPDANRATFKVENGQRLEQATLTFEALAPHQGTLEAGGAVARFFVQARGLRAAGKVGGRFADSLVVSTKEGLRFEAAPWFEGGQRGALAFCDAGIFELAFDTSLSRGVTGATVTHEGRQVGEAQVAKDNSGKVILALDPGVPAVVVPWLLLTVLAGVYNRRVTRSRRQTTDLHDVGSARPAPRT